MMGSVNGRGACDVEKAIRFLKPVDYSLSAFLGHYFLYNTNMSKYSLSAEAILYPSIAEKGAAINFAFSPAGTLKLLLKQVFHSRYKSSTAKGVNMDSIRAGKANAE